MDKPLSLRKNFSWMFAGNIISSGCQWIMLMSMTKLLPEEIVGHYVLALAITTPIVMFSMLQLRLVQVTDVKNKYKFSDYLGTRLFTNLMAVLCLGMVFLSLTSSYDSSVYTIITFVLLFKLVESTSDIVYGLMQKYERLDKVALSMIFRNFGGALLLSLVLYFSKNLILGVLVLFLWSLLLLFLFDKRNTEKVGRFVPHFSIKSVLSIMWTGFPLGIVMALISLYNSIPRYFIEAHLGSDQLAIFGGMAFAVTGASRCIISLGYSVSARLAKYYAENRKAYVMLLIKIVIINIGMALAAILFGALWGEEFLTLVYKKEYAQQPDVFVWLLVAAGGNMISAMLMYGMLATRSFKSQVPLHSVSTILCIVCCWYFIPTYGIKGAAWSMIIAVLSKIIGSIFIILLALNKPLVSERENL